MAYFLVEPIKKNKNKMSRKITQVIYKAIWASVAYVIYMYNTHMRNSEEMKE